MKKKKMFEKISDIKHTKIKVIIMASYDQLNNKLWRYRISLGKNPVTGKYEYVSKTGFKRKSDAKNAAELVERQIRNGEYIAPSTTTFNYVADEWINHYSRDTKISSVRAREKPYITLNNNLVIEVYKQ